MTAKGNIITKQQDSLDNQETNNTNSIDSYELPVLLGIEEFTPTTLQCKLLLHYINDNEDNLSTGQMLRRIGHDYTLWYQWKRNNPKFLVWWNRCLESAFTGEHLTTVWNAVYRRALRHSDAAAKLFVERHDAQYKPSTSQEHLHSFAGYQPTETTAELAERSRERERKVIDSREIEDEM